MYEIEIKLYLEIINIVFLSKQNLKSSEKKLFDVSYNKISKIKKENIKFFNYKDITIIKKMYVLFHRAPLEDRNMKIKIKNEESFDFTFILKIYKYCNNDDNSRNLVKNLLISNYEEKFLINKCFQIINKASIKIHISNEWIKKVCKIIDFLEDLIQFKEPVFLNLSSNIINYEEIQHLPIEIKFHFQINVKNHYVKYDKIKSNISLGKLRNIILKEFNLNPFEVDF